MNDSTNTMNRLKNKSKRLRTVLAQQLGTEVDCLSAVLGNEDQKKNLNSINKNDNDLKKEIKLNNNEINNLNKLITNDITDTNDDEHEKTYTDSSTFLKGINF